MHTLSNADIFIVAVGINAVKQMEIFRILAGILHLGNVEILEDEKSSDATVIPVSLECKIHIYSRVSAMKICSPLTVFIKFGQLNG